jgi:hypothetical protein
MTTEMLFGVGVFIAVVSFAAGYIAGYRERGEQ